MSFHTALYSFWFNDNKYQQRFIHVMHVSPDPIESPHVRQFRLYSSLVKDEESATCMNRVKITNLMTQYTEEKPEGGNRYGIVVMECEEDIANGNPRVIHFKVRITDHEILPVRDAIASAYLQPLVDGMPPAQAPQKLRRILAASLMNVLSAN